MSRKVLEPQLASIEGRLFEACASNESPSRSRNPANVRSSLSEVLWGGLSLNAIKVTISIPFGKLQQVLLQPHEQMVDLVDLVFPLRPG